MAKTTMTVYTDDLTGEEINGNGGAVSFAFDGTTYTIDLTDKNKDKLQKALQPYIDKAAKKTTAKRKTSGTDAAVIREWAVAEKLIEEGSRGRIPQEIKDAYKNRNK